MDSIPSEITIKYTLLTKADQISFAIKDNLCVLARIEGELKIRIGEELFFQDNGILLLEFCINLIKWINQCKEENYSDFSYWQIDYDESPILEFLAKDKGYMILSEWSLFLSNKAFCKDMFLVQMEKLAQDLKKDIQQKYQVDVLELEKSY
jgi:hypothetical protein